MRPCRMKLSKNCSSSLLTLLALRERAARDQRQLFYAEGVRALIEAAASSFPLEALFYCPSLLPSEFIRRFIRCQRKRGVPCSQLTPAEYRQISRCEEPQGILAVMQQQWTKLPDVTADAIATGAWLALDEIRAPGNLGTIIRSAEAFGACGLILLDNKVDPFDPGCVRASMGALFHVPLVRTSLAELLAWKTKHNCQLIGTSPQGTTSHFDFPFEPRSILWMGSERKGLLPQQQSLCDGIVKIPMCGRSDSLNVAIASGICLAEVFRQRHKSQ